MTIRGEQSSMVQRLVDRALPWVKQQEQQILQEGYTLTQLQLDDAASVEIDLDHPQRVRILEVPDMPFPDDPTLKQAAKDTGLIDPSRAGMTLNYGIFLREDRADDRGLLIHELTHVSQWERLGRKEFLLRYISELMEENYQGSTLEEEARRKQAEFEGSTAR